jgi:hypothetical protein
MSDKYQHVRSGERLNFSAESYNAMIDAAAKARHRHMRLSPSKTGRDSLFVSVVNKTGRFLERFDVVGLESPFYSTNNDEFFNHILFRGVVPQKNHKGKFAVLQQSAEPNDVVRACLYGTTIARVQNKNNDHEIRSCDIVEGETGFLVSGEHSEVLWRDNYSDWSIIRIGSGGGRSTLFPVVLARSGGTNGTYNSPATWRYNVKDAFTDELLTRNVNPVEIPHQWKRPQVGAMLEATFGYAHYDKDEQLILGWINEVAEQESCS